MSEIREKELIDTPEMGDGEIIHQMPIKYNDRNEAQIINTTEWTDRFGRVLNRVCGNTRTGDNMSRLKVNHFGSIASYDVDSKPASLIKCRDTEVIEITGKHKCYQGKFLISRRFLSKVLQKWTYITGIRYYQEKDDGRFTGLNLWCDNISCNGIITPCLTGEKAKQMIRDIIYLTRHINPDRMPEYLSNGKISSNLYSTMKHNASGINAKSFKEQILGMKDRLYYDNTSHNISWSFPKISMNYLIGVIDELQSGDYMMEVERPAIYDLYHFPLKCKDTFVKPLTTTEHKDNLGDYDITQYVWERD